VPPPSLDREGFTLVPHTSAVTDFTDTGRRRRLPREIAALARAGHRRRPCRRPRHRAALLKSDRRDQFVNSLPAGFVHVDTSRESFAQFAALQLGDHPDREALLAGRYVGFNIWRVLTPPPQDLPLAVCAAISVTRGRPGDRRGAGRRRRHRGVPLRLLAVPRHPAHRWYYYRDMRPDEALIFKQFDTADPPSSASPTSPSPIRARREDAVPRASAEIRAFAYGEA
jgi:hypothetical protein